MRAMIGQVAYSHLFPGVRIELTPTPGPQTGRGPLVRLELRFLDGVNVGAEVIHDGRGACLAVDGYRTAAGTDIPPKIWQVASPEPTELESTSTIRLGSRLPGST